MSFKEEDSSHLIKDLFFNLVQRKRSALNRMKSVMKYMDPSDESLSNRYSQENLTSSSEDDVLFDTTARSVILEYSLTSLSDIINPVSPWFSLFILNQKA